jgi:hypothetical protein
MNDMAPKQLFGPQVTFLDCLSINYTDLFLFLLGSNYFVTTIWPQDGMPTCFMLLLQAPACRVDDGAMMAADDSYQQQMMNASITMGPNNNDSCRCLGHNVSFVFFFILT